MVHKIRFGTSEDYCHIQLSALGLIVEVVDDYHRCAYILNREEIIELSDFLNMLRKE
jgi:hypothetical protein